MNRVARRVGDEEDDEREDEDDEDVEVGIGRGGVDVCVGGGLTSDK